MNFIGQDLQAHVLVLQPGLLCRVVLMFLIRDVLDCNLFVLRSLPAQNLILFPHLFDLCGQKLHFLCSRFH